MSGAGAASGAAGVRALVTGGAGFIGSHLTEELVRRGREVVVVDDLSTGSRANVPAGVGLVEGDAASALGAGGELAGERFDEVFHLAATVGVMRVIEDPSASIENNVAKTGAVLRFAASNGPRRGEPARVLFASSSEVYGKSSATPFREDADLVFGTTTASRWSYGMTKALGEHLALDFSRRRGVGVVIARLFNTVGPGQSGRYGMVLPRFVRAALAGEALPVFGDGGQTRCFCDVRDVAWALAELMGTGLAAGRAVNVGRDLPVSVLELAETVNRVLGGSGGVELVPYGEAYGPGFEDLRERKPDLTRLRGLVRFSPRVPLEQTIRDLAETVSSSSARGAGV